MKLKNGNGENAYLYTDQNDKPYTGIAYLYQGELYTTTDLLPHGETVEKWELKCGIGQNSEQVSICHYIPDEYYLTIAERTHSQYHRKKAIIRHKATGNTWIFAEFDKKEQLDFFAKTLGFEYEKIGESCSEIVGVCETFRLNRKINDHKYFWKMEELPDGARPIKALCNGSIVDCYFVNDGETIDIFRPNPNAKDIYHPLSVEEHIQHRTVYGSY